jgi:hypothetical protein
VGWLILFPIFTPFLFLCRVVILIQFVWYY